MSTATATPSSPAVAPSEAGAARNASVSRRALAIMAVALVVRSWLLVRSWFVGDDLVFIGRADTMATGSRSYYFDDYNSHVMPGAFVLVRVLNAWFPWNFLPVALVCIAMIAGVFWLFYRLLRRLFGPVPAILVPLAVFCFSPITVPAFLWWAAALNQLPQNLALIGALLAHVIYLQTGRLRYGWGGALALVAGLAFSEKTLLAVPLVFGLTYVFFASGAPLPRLRTVVRRHWRVWSAYVPLAVAYLTYYVVAVPSPTHVRTGSGDVVAVATKQLGHALLPGLLGGPWQWLPVSVNGAVADPPAALRWVSFTLVAGFVAWSIVRCRAATGAWLLAAGYVAIDIVLLAESRALVVGPLIGAEMRYSTDLCAVVLLCATLAVIPLQPVARPADHRAADAGEVQVLVRRAWYEERSAQLRTRVQEAAPGVSGRTMIVLGTVVIVAGSLLSTGRFDRIWAPQVSRDYVDAARTDIAHAARPLVLADVASPESVVWSIVYPYNKVSYLFHGATPRPTYLTSGLSTDQLWVPDESGHLRAAAIVGMGARKGPQPNCGWMVRSSPVTVALTAPTAQWSWYVRIGYISSRDATVKVTAGSTTMSVAVRRGLHALYFLADGAVSGVRIGGMPRGASLCTDEITVGSPRPIPGTTP